jgi:hypothetical protein
MGAPRDSTHDPEATFSGEFLFGETEPAQAARQALSYAELLTRLSALMQSNEGCEKVTVVGVTPLDVPDTDGCNWSFTLVLDTAGVEAEVYGLAYAQIIATARTSWNLK